MMRDERGAAAVEMLVTFPVVLVFLLGNYMLSYLFCADMIMERAASAAARAAAVYFADSDMFHADRDSRVAYVREAARRVLFASPTLDPSSLHVAVSSTATSPVMLTATVDANFECGVFVVGLLCGLDRRVTLNATASLPYQGQR